MVSVRCRKSSQISPDHAASHTTHCSGLSRVAQAERHGGARLAGSETFDGDELDVPSRVTARTEPVLTCQGSRLKWLECSDRQLERVETGNELLDDDAVSPSRHSSPHASTAVPRELRHCVAR